MGKECAMLVHYALHLQGQLARITSNQDWKEWTRLVVTVHLSSFPGTTLTRRSLLKEGARVKQLLEEYAFGARDGASGLQWRHVGAQVPSDGIELSHERLANAITGKLRKGEGGVRFGEREWAILGVTGLRMEHFVLVEGQYYQPAEGVAQLLGRLGVDGNELSSPRVELVEGAQMMARCQDLPKEAFLTPEQAARVFMRHARRIKVLSYGWRLAGNPDPDGRTFAAVCHHVSKVLKADAEDREKSVRKEVQRLKRTGSIKSQDHAEHAEETLRNQYRIGDGPIGLFWEYAPPEPSSMTRATQSRAPPRATARHRAPLRATARAL